MTGDNARVAANALVEVNRHTPDIGVTGRRAIVFDVFVIFTGTRREVKQLVVHMEGFRPMSDMLGMGAVFFIMMLAVAVLFVLEFNQFDLVEVRLADDRKCTVDTHGLGFSRR